MAYEILKAGHPVLQKIAEPIAAEEFGSMELIQLSDLLLHAMQEEGGVALAAPQVGISKRMIVVGIGEHTRNKRKITIDNYVLINPVIYPLSDELEEGYEACLSVEVITAKVPRYKHILCKGFDLYGNVLEQTLEGLHARILQHEVDHLDGILFLERVKDPKTFAHYDELKKRMEINAS